MQKWIRVNSFLGNAVGEIAWDLIHFFIFIILIMLEQTNEIRAYLKQTKLERT